MQQFPYRHFQAIRDQFQSSQGDILPAPFDCAVVRLVHIDQIREPFLTKAFAFAVIANHPAQARLQFVDGNAAKLGTLAVNNHRI